MKCFELRVLFTECGWSQRFPIKETVKVKFLDGEQTNAKEDGAKKENKERPKEGSDGKEPRESRDQKGGKADSEGGKADGKGGQGEKPVCRYFLSEAGCKKGQKCSFPHEWKGISKMGRCWLRFLATHAIRVPSQGGAACEKGDW